MYRFFIDMEALTPYRTGMDEENKNLEFGDELDLHCFSPDDTGFLVDYFLKISHEKGLSMVRIVHGKGKSVKKREVLQILSTHPTVESFGNDRFNWGATVVILKTD